MGIGGGAHAGPLSRRQRQVRRAWRYVLVIGVPAILLGLSTAGALVMFGRGAFRGRLRRRFWRVPPPWLDQDVPSGTASAGD
jgi:hypothetical protein